MVEYNVLFTFKLHDIRITENRNGESRRGEQCKENAISMS